MSDKIPVVHLITMLELGGAQGNTIHTVRNLNRNKFDVYLLSGKGGYWDNEILNDPQLKNSFFFIPSLIRELNPFKDMIALWNIYWALKKIKPTILHTHSSKAGILGRIAGWLANVPIIIHTFHGFGFNDEQKLWTKWGFILSEKIVAPMTNKLIFVSNSNRTEAMDLGIGKESQYALIRSGVPIKTIQTKAHQTNSDQLKNSLGLRKDSKIITTIGAFKPQKNLSDFLIVAEKLISAGNDIEFIIIGDGILKPNLMSLCESLKIKERVFFIGWRKDIPEILSISDLFVMTSLWEGLPRALVEAMIIGIPAVCFDADGVKDVLNNKTGSLIKKKDTNSMVSEILNLLKNPSLYKEKSENAVKAIDINFDIDHMVTQQEVLYQSLI